MVGGSTELRPYDQLQRNPDGDMFGSRRGQYPVQVEDEPYPSESAKKEVDVVPLVVGVLIGVVFVCFIGATVYYSVRGRRHPVQQTYISMEPSAVPL